MRGYVLDASVLAAVAFDEEFSDVARGLLAVESDWLAPDLISVEIANVIWKRHRRGEVSAERAALILSELSWEPMKITPCSELAEEALGLALNTGRSLYDCLYLALAVKTGTVLVTADQRLVNALAGHPLGKRVVWLGSIHS